MVRRITFWLALFCAVLPGVATSQDRERAPQRCILRVEVDGIISGATTDYLRDAIGVAQERDCQAVLVELDTPGGHLAATRAIARSFLNAPLPIVVYVAPSGARAGSAGVFVTMAGHVAAMAPATNIGAAHPVSVGGGDPEEAGGEHLAAKLENDTAAFARAIAQRRGRNADWAEEAVRESRSATATEAVEQDVVDMIAESRGALLAELDGRTVSTERWEATLHTTDAPIVDLDPTLQQRARSVLSDPNLAYVFLMIGMLGLMMELFQPGLIVPGVIGVFSLLLAAIGLDVLPVQIGGVILLAVALALFVAEMYVTSWGLLAAGGLGCLVLGSILLLDTRDPEFFVEPSVRISWLVIAPLALVLGVAVVLLARQANRIRQRRQETGREGLVGAMGRADGPIDRRGGHARVQGERWNASSEARIQDGEAVRVVGVDGLRLRVQPAPPQEEKA